jgi:hypothetical protein
VVHHAGNHFADGAVPAGDRNRIAPRALGCNFAGMTGISRKSYTRGINRLLPRSLESMPDPKAGTAIRGWINDVLCISQPIIPAASVCKQADFSKVCVYFESPGSCFMNFPGLL